MVKRRFISIFISLLIALAAGFLVLLPISGYSVVNAQGGYDSPCEVLTSTFYLDTYIDNNANPGTYPSETVDNPTGALWVDGSRMHVVESKDSGDAIMVAFSGGGIYSGTFQINLISETMYNVWERKIRYHPDYGASVNDPGWSSVVYATPPGTNFTAQFGTIAIWVKSGALNDASYYVDAIEITNVDGTCEPVEEPISIYTCTTIPDWHFSGDYTDTWTLSGGATLSNSIVTLPDGGAVSQTIASLVPNKTYNLLVSVSTISPTPTITDPVTLPLLAELGSTQATLSITGTDVFTASGLDTGIGYIYDFVLTNTASISSEINIDWACLYDMGDADEDIVCIAPTNGEFTTANHWGWFYNAEWNQSSLNAYLPYNDTVSDTGKSLVVSTGTYSLPELITDTYLILAFDSMALGQNGIVSARMGDSWHEFDVNSSMYRFEADISTQAGLSATTVSFVNSGAPDGEFTAIDDLTVDNVCIYVSDSPPNSPEPLNPWLDAFSFGFNFTCPDVPALLAGYNIDVYTPTAAYDAGVSSWTEEYWVPWLVGALWVNVGSPISCLLVEFMRLVAAIAEQFINIFTNSINWWYQTLVAGVPWLQNGMFYPALYGGYWLSWYANNSGYGLIEQQNVMSQNTMDVGLETGSVITQIMTDLSEMWNGSIVPWMGYSATASNTQNLDPDAATSLSDFFSWLTSGIMVLFDLLWAALSWLAGLITMAVGLPFEVYHSVRDGISETSYATDDVMCVSQNFWCYFWAGVYLVNETTGNTIAYPIVILGLCIITIAVIIRNIFAMFRINIG